MFGGFPIFKKQATKETTKQQVPETHFNSLQLTQTHANSFQLTPTHSNSFQLTPTHLSIQILP